MFDTIIGIEDPKLLWWDVSDIKFQWINHKPIEGNKHGPVYGKFAQVYWNHNFLGQTPKSSSKVLLKLDLSIFCIVSSIVVLGIQI